MFRQLRNINFYVVFFIDLVLFALALLFAYLIRFEFVLSAAMVDQYLALLPAVLVLKSGVFFWMGLYRGMFRYAGLSDLWALLKAVGVSSLVLVFVMLFIHRFQGYSRAVFVIDGGLALLFTGGVRVLIRYLFREYLGHKEPHTGEKTPVLIYGAGNAGEKLYREISENPRLGFQVMGFGDDDPYKKGRSIHGLTVLGGTGDLARIKQKHQIAEVLIAMPSSTGRQMRAVAWLMRARHAA
jgi:FlaA1/EpsC-like NDP-sugar epimerase